MGRTILAGKQAGVTLALLGVTGALGLVGCGSAKLAEPTNAPKAVRGSSVERYFPLEEGRLYSYATSEDGDTGMLVARVHRTDASHGELRLSNASKRFVFDDAGVAYDGGAYILKVPVEVGTSWPGEHGGTTRIVTLDAAPAVPAGTYTGCVQTLEEGGRVPGARYATTYCPGVGMVLLEVHTPGGDARAALKSYGFPVKIQ
jgi:hypothetical protein